MSRWKATNGITEPRRKKAGRLKRTLAEGLGMILLMMLVYIVGVFIFVNFM